MAKRSSNGSHSGQRDPLNRSLTKLLAVPYVRPLVLPALPSPPALIEIEDRRNYHPGRTTRPPGASRPGASRVVQKGLHQLRFEAPKLVAICRRRQIRKEILFALNKTRKGSGSMKRRNFWSSISCSRR